MHSQEALTFGFDDLPNGVILVKDGSGIIDANAAMLDLLGCDLEWVVGRPISGVMTKPAAMLYHSSVYVQVRAIGRVDEIYLDLRNKNGAAVPVLCSAILRKSATETIVIVSVTRMTERRRLEEDLLRTRRITEQIPGVVYQYLVRPDGSHSMPYASEALRALFGVSPLEVQRDAASLLTHVHPEDVDRFSASIGESISSLQVWRHQFRARRNNELPWRWLEGHASPERLPDGGTLWHGFVQDVTDRKAVEDELRDKQSADQANKAKSEFLARVSHELRTPLNAILGFAQILALDHKAPLPPVQRHRVALIEDAGRDLLALIDEVLDITRIESGSVDLQPVWVDVEATAIRVCRMLDEAARQRGIRVSLAIDPGLRVNADQARLGQVLTNLMSNAVKYTRDRGSVTVMSSIKGEQVSIAVHDNGVGMNEQQLEHLFEPFNRLGAERTTTQGTGLGLVIVRRLVEAMGGSIVVQSNKQDGTTFEVLMPHKIEPRERSGVVVPLMPEPAVPKLAKPAATVLYVEDNVVNAMVMETILEMRPGLTMHVESTGTSAIEWLRQHHADVVLLDMNLPDYDGLSLLAAMRASCSPMPLAIAVSADAMPHVIQHALQAGFAQYWTKPLDVEQTLMRFEEALQASFSARASWREPLQRSSSASDPGSSLP